MKIESGSTNKYVPFVAVDATDLKTRETGLSSFTVYRARNGATPVAMTTPTIVEASASNMPGLYWLLADEDTTIDSGADSQAMAFHITHAGMAPVSVSIDIERPKITQGNSLDVTSTGEAGIDLANVNVPAGAIPFLGIVDNGTAQSATGTTLVTRAANPDNSIQSGMTLFAYGSTQGYWQSVIIDSVSTDTLTIAAWPLATPSGTITYYVQGTPNGSPTLLPDVNVKQISGDATAADNLEAALDGTGGVTITLEQLAFNPTGSGDCIIMGGSGNGNGIGFTRSGSGGVFDSAVTAELVAAAAELLTTQMTEAYAADGTAPTLAQALFLIQQMITEKSASGTTLTAKKLDGSTTAATFTLNDASNPTSITRAS